jgi:hypothetical protein
MRQYNHFSPLIFIHTPKTAGTAVREIFKGWFPKNFKLHYYDHVNGIMPKKIDYLWLRRIKGPILIYGHFNKKRGFGVEQYYPNVKQFITIWRDPFETAVSDYFFSRKSGINHAIKPKSLGRSLEEHIMTDGSSMLNHFPRDVSLDNYKDIIEEYFVAFGITENLSSSLQIMAKRLGKDFDTSSLEMKNVTHRDQDVPNDLRERFMEANILEFEIYNYVKAQVERYSTTTVPFERPLKTDRGDA